MKKKILIAIVLIVVIVGTTIGIIYYKNTRPLKIDKDFSKINLTKVNKVMFVAHPDDDALWGGDHLLKDGKEYLVVCITCGSVKKRVDEFTKVMNNTNSEYVILGFPDKTNGEKDNWETVKDDIKKDLKEILSLKDWDLVVTHNPEGEYGHIHHIMTNEIVTNLANKEKLMYFGKYYKKDILTDYKEQMTELSEEDYQKKYELLKDYKSQSNVVYDMFGHMIPYENWISYEEWYNEI